VLQACLPLRAFRFPAGFSECGFFLDCFLQLGGPLYDPLLKLRMGFLDFFFRLLVFGDIAKTAHKIFFAA
jgi:hypothetical protein